MKEIRNCKKHGDTIFYIRIKKNGYQSNYCKACSLESTRKLRRENKEKLVEMFGGKCCRCGYKKCINALHFHHRDPRQKDKGLCRMGSSDIKKLIEEAKKCILVCANCHAEIEAASDKG